MVRALVVSDEVDAGLRACAPRRCDVDVIIAAGDLPFDYLADLCNTVDRPGVLVPGNHDPDLSGFSDSTGLCTRAGLPDTWPGPAGFDDADGRIVDVAGLRIAGLGGCVRYRPGPNQWTQSQQARRARRLVRAARRMRRRDGRGVDVLLTHAPPRHCGDGEDAPHHGFDCLHGVVAALAPRLLLHGHIHPYGQPAPDRFLGETRVVNVVGRRIMEL
ncbi:metallophosphoesterase family protein [Pseudonocardia sp. GCM10023141]|uniref:metallophosphoesterase family protein n=1 Tax=Pseudonocardia sp. GCM10023141 TaxID=3252653 RepID=UPI00362215D5